MKDKEKRRRWNRERKIGEDEKREKMEKIKKREEMVEKIKERKERGRKEEKRKWRTIILKTNTLTTKDDENNWH